MLLAFLEAPQRPLSREQLLQATRVREDVFDRTIDVQILRLRRKLERDPRAPRVIQTERGVGSCVRRSCGAPRARWSLEPMDNSVRQFVWKRGCSSSSHRITAAG